MPLTDREQAILELERSWWTRDQPKDAQILERFGCSVEAYHHELSSLLDAPDALAHDPLVVRRLRRLRERRRRERIDALTPETAGEVAR